MNCKTLAFGSTLNGFGDRKCDLDFCLFFDTNNRGKNGSINMLFKARNVLRFESSIINHIRRLFFALDVKIIKKVLFDHVAGRDVGDS
jgi:hypothetical protein